MGEWCPGTPPAGFSRIYPEVDALLIPSTYIIWYGVAWQSEIQVLLNLETQLTISWSKPDVCNAVLLLGLLERSSTQTRSYSTIGEPKRHTVSVRPETIIYTLEAMYFLWLLLYGLYARIFLMISCTY